MSKLLRQRWGLSRPPDVPFELNRTSQQRVGLVAWWPMLASQGTGAIRDLGGRGFNLTGVVGTPDWINTQQYGAGLYLAAGEGFRDTYPSWFDITQPWTLYSFVRIDNPAVNFPMAFGFMCAANSEYVGIGASATGDSDLKIATYGETPGDGSLLTAGEFYHFTLIYDGTDLLAYLDGVFNYSVTPSGSDWQTSDTIFIGTRPTGDQFQGVIINLHLCSRALTATEVWRSYNQQTRWELCKPQIRQWQVKAPAAAPPPTAALPIFPPPDAIHSQIFGGVTVR